MSFRRTIICGLIAIGCCLLIPSLFSKSKYLIYVLNLIGIYVIIATGLNIITGFCGQLSIGQGGFCAIGAYVSALMTLHFSSPFPLNLLLSALCSGVAGLILGITCLRLGGIYVAMTTLGFGAIVEVILFSWEKLTRGSEGIRDIPSATIGPYVLQKGGAFFYVISIIAIILVLFAFNVVRSRVGRAFMAIRDDQLAASLSGVSITKYKLYAFVMSAIYGGIGGSLYAYLTRVIFPEVFSVDFSILVLMMIVLGGMGSILGSIVGAGLLTVSFELLRPLEQYQMVVYGIMIVVITIFVPRGLLGAGVGFPSLLRRVFRK